ncbi:MAG: hypothetical protein HY758_04985 [Nitrospirae bacterium]|nr:hypothetical protein [Nitrospirota bacterium]
MQTISLKSNSPDIVIPLLKNALDREKRILMETLIITREKIAKMAESLDVDVNKLLKGEVEHTEANDMQLIELEGEIEISRHIEAELKELESVEICK